MFINYGPHIIGVSERLYRALLAMYPRQFRREYGHEMLQTFRTSCRETLRQEGSVSFLRLWGETIYDLVLTSCGEHYRTLLACFKRLSGMEKELLDMSSLLQFKVALRSDIGNRAANEDSVFSNVPQDQQVLEEKGALFVVADGMGGHQRGELASQLVVEEVNKYYYASTESDPEAVLAKAVKQANRSMYQHKEGMENAGNSGMGSTGIAAVVQDEHVYVANVGDSRAYILHNGQLRQISEDHSVPARLVREGTISAEEARSHPDKNILYRALGTENEVEVDSFVEPVATGDALFLCTDGLVDVFSDDEFREAIERYTPDECVMRLIATANERGAKDNISALVVRIG